MFKARLGSFTPLFPTNYTPLQYNLLYCNTIWAVAKFQISAPNLIKKKIFVSFFFFHFQLLENYKKNIYTYFFFHFLEHSNKCIKIYFLHFSSFLHLVKPKNIIFFTSYPNKFIKFIFFIFFFQLYTVKTFSPPYIHIYTSIHFPELNEKKKRNKINFKQFIWFIEK